ncbi:hypothetical protein SERLADRAFT_446425 [Serpula lacrymans var. lacrymans S7.9]|uniref:Bystin-domain-containing protein n=1 Tax=Serpula lacrymans var. lacrymans (strain S7.9) TaxID=578457 RepID=F8NPI9_SERL9|nr:uncharacterized protein SERLADRAFT_446425 [Serpula lacrymans var. lacrymans S7.9]EGO27199.1 hypothetical protein SERLADRAFT_446425 [Serpula lacrymans var. lacrymans S7.9]
MPRTQKPAGKARHDPLYVQLGEDELQAKYGRLSQPGKRKKSRKSSGDDDENGETILDPKTSKRIFELAKDQQEELEMPEDDEVVEEEEDEKLKQPRTRPLADQDDESEGDFENDMDDNEDAEEMFQIDAGDMEALDAMLPANAGERKTLADIIFAKLESGESGGAAVIQKIHQDKDRPDPALGLDPKVVEAYTKVGLFLSKYKSGPLPKIFKVIPSLPAWARMLAMTHPENWTPHACRAATRIFISSIAFFKGIVFPMLDSGCSLKEAAIIASILAKKKVPVLHSSAALMRIAEMDYTGPNSLFIRVLIDKKYQLPYKVVDSLVFHFIRLSNTYKARGRGDSEKLPVLWHQSLLAFCQRYSPDLTPDQKDALLDVIRVNPHAQIGPEVRRELVNSVARGEPRPDVPQDVDMS